ncbi:hypothetical protein P7K49_000100 [Saguinus oedipus]|uniref:Uncharacterized protein n=1 Tax=Saguinus oedipus TaxID=9490 RepID=A0ABQ9WAP9_SAGOE|nr:hypothetical protein P7K49_000100 [Saguinus oedipus]
MERICGEPRPTVGLGQSPLLLLQRVWVQGGHVLLVPGVALLSRRFGKRVALLNQLRAVFDQIIELQNAQDAIYRAALEELQRRLQFEEKKKQRESEVWYLHL